MITMSRNSFARLVTHAYLIHQYPLKGRFKRFKLIVNLTFTNFTSFTMFTVSWGQLFCKIIMVMMVIHS